MVVYHLVIGLSQNRGGKYLMDTLITAGIILIFFGIIFYDVVSKGED
jgi:hypothetical protein